MSPDEIRREFESVKKKLKWLDDQLAEHGPLEVRLLGQVDDKIDGAAKGFERYVVSAIRSEMDALTKVLPAIEAFMREQGDRDKVRLQMKLDTQAEFTAAQAREDARVSALLGQHQAAANIGAVHVESAHKADELPNSINGTHKRRVAMLVAIAALITALAGLIGAALGSHSAAPAATPTPGGSHH